MQTILFTGAFTLAGILVGHLLTRDRDSTEAQREHARWLRDRRVDAYTELLAAAVHLGPVGIDVGMSQASTAEKIKAHNDAVRRVYDAHSRVAILGPQLVRSEGGRLLDLGMQVLNAGIRNDIPRQKATEVEIGKAELRFVDVAQSIIGINPPTGPGRWKVRRALRRADKHNRKVIDDLTSTQGDARDAG